MIRLNTNSIPFRRLFNVRKLPNGEAFIAVAENGTLLYVTEELAGMALMHDERMLFRLERGEFRAHVERAQKNGKLQKAIQNGWVTQAEIDALLQQEEV